MKNQFALRFLQATFVAIAVLIVVMATNPIPEIVAGVGTALAVVNDILAVVILTLVFPPLIGLTAAWLVKLVSKQPSRLDHFVIMVPLLVTVSTLQYLVLPKLWIEFSTKYGVGGQGEPFLGIAIAAAPMLALVGYMLKE